MQRQYSSNDHQERLWSLYAKLFSRFCKYHNKGKFLSRYLKENGNFHFANINGEILQVRVQSGYKVDMNTKAEI